MDHISFWRCFVQAFEHLIQLGVFQLAGLGPGKVVAKQFAKYSSVPEMDEVKFAVEKAGLTMLKRWWKNGQR
jgi:hypothetical protein